MPIPHFFVFPFNMPVLFPDHTGNERKRWRPAKEMKKTSRAILLEIVRSFVFVHEIYAIFLFISHL